MIEARRISFRSCGTLGVRARPRAAFEFSVAMEQKKLKKH
jgi:hypothetical protein